MARPGTAELEGLERVGPAGDVQPAQDSNYLVTVGNRTSGVFSELIVAFLCTGSPEPDAVGFPNVEPGQARDFSLCSCSDLQAYIVGIGVGGTDFVQIIPAEGLMTPQMANQPPEDPGPCEDGWVIVNVS